MDKVKVGIIGCGNISNIYLKNLTQVFKNVDVVACADIAVERAKQRSEEFGISKACSVEELLADPEIRIVLNLTIPTSHSDINFAALNAGKNVYVEKTLALNREDAQKTLALAKKKGLLVGCAPDTFLGAGLQTCRKLIDEGWIGKPTLASGFMVSGGPESWHPAPEFLYKQGAGPLFDMGPYYITAMITLLGAVQRVSGSSRKTFEQRIITSAAKFGSKINVDIDTNIAGVLEFKSGALATLVTSFDTNSYMPRMEIFGTEGSMIVPDPNMFEGPVKIKRYDASEWSDIPLTHCHSDNSRGLGVADMAHALLNGEKHRASGELAYHVLDVICSLMDSANELKHHNVKSVVERPEAMPMGLANQML